MNSDFIKELFDYLNKLNDSDDIDFMLPVSSNEGDKKLFDEQIKAKEDTIIRTTVRLKQLYNTNAISSEEYNKFYTILETYMQSLDKIENCNDYSSEEFGKIYYDMQDKQSYVTDIKDKIYNIVFNKTVDDYMNDKLDETTFVNNFESIGISPENAKGYLELYNKKKAGNLNNNTEQQSVEDNEGSLSNDNASVVDYDIPEVVEEPTIENNIPNNNSLSFDELVNNLKYDGTKNLAGTIRRMSNDNELRQISAELDKLDAKRDEKGNLSFVDAVRYSNLSEKKYLILEKNIKSKNTLMQNVREGKLEKNFEKQMHINDQIDSLNKIDKNSYLGRFISKKIEKHLDKKLNKLMAKQAKLVNKQKLSTLTSLKVQKRRIKAKAALKTGLTGIKKSVSEIKNIAIDIKNLVSKPEKLQELRRSQIVMTSYPQPISIQLPMNENVRSM